MNATKTHITGIRAVSIPVDDQDATLRFYLDTLGFTTLRDNPTPNGGRWIELIPGNDDVIVTLEPAAPDVARGAIGIRFTTDDAQAAHTALHTAGVDTDENPPLARRPNNVRLPRHRRQHLLHHPDRLTDTAEGIAFEMRQTASDLNESRGEILLRRSDYGRLAVMQFPVRGYTRRPLQLAASQSVIDALTNCILAPWLGGEHRP